MSCWVTFSLGTASSVWYRVSLFSLLIRSNMDRLAIYGDNKLGIDKTLVEQCRVSLRLLIMQIYHGLTFYYGTYWLILLPLTTLITLLKHLPYSNQSELLPALVMARYIRERRRNRSYWSLWVPPAQDGYKLFVTASKPAARWQNDLFSVPPEL